LIGSDLRRTFFHKRFITGIHTTVRLHRGDLGGSVGIDPVWCLGRPGIFGNKDFRSMTDVSLLPVMAVIDTTMDLSDLFSPPGVKVK